MEPTEPQANNGNKKALVAFVLVLAVVLVAVGVAMFGKKDSAEDAATTPSTTQTTTPGSASDGTANSQSEATTTSGSYKDGTYSATGSYMTPGGQQKIGVTVTLKDGVVTDTSLQQTAENQETQEYQGKFASGYKTLVVGKKIDEIQVSRVSGSSLTSQGFHNALDNIEQQAKS